MSPCGLTKGAALAARGAGLAALAAAALAAGAALAATSTGVLSAAASAAPSSTAAASTRALTVDLPFGFFVLAVVAGALAVDPCLSSRAKRAKAAAPAPATATTTHLPPPPWLAASALLAAPWRALQAHWAATCFAASSSPSSPPALAWAPPAPLPASVAAARLAAAGPNALPGRPPAPLWRLLASELWEPQQVLLLGVAVLYAALGEADEAGLALGVIAAMVLAEVLVERRAKAAVARLRASAPVFTAVLRVDDRDGGGGAAAAVPTPARVHVSALVPGDVLLLRAGDEVPADALLLAAPTRGLRVNEAALTGESLPVLKTPVGWDAGAGDGVVAEGTPSSSSASLTPAPLHARPHLLHAGTTIVSGRCRALVVATGAATERGAAAAARASAKERRTPLQALLKQLAGRLTWVALAASITGGLLGLVHGSPWPRLVLIALSLAFATIPEELPILIAAVLGVGARVLAGRGIFVKRLRAMEALVNVSAIVADKTGTLTANKLALAGWVGKAEKEEGGEGEEAVSASGPPRENTSTWHPLSATAAATAPLVPALAALLRHWQLGDVAALLIESSSSAADAQPESLEVRLAVAPSAEPAPGSCSAPAAIATTAASPATVFADPFDAAVREWVAAACPSSLLHNPAAASAPLTLLTEVPFDAFSKLSAVIYTVNSPKAQQQSSDLLVVLRGAPTAIYAACGAALPPAFPAASASGLRVIALAAATLQAGTPAADAVAGLVAAAAGESSDSANSDGASATTLLPTQLTSAALLAALATPPAASSALTPLGGLAFQDPPRPAAAAALAACRSAGVAVFMCTGDAPETAAAIAAKVGVDTVAAAVDCGAAVSAAATAAASSTDASPPWLSSALDAGARVFSRATPAHKLALVQALQASARHTVLMTGDGVNDVAGFSVADVSVAVASACESAQDAASVLLLGDADLSSLVALIAEGRRLAHNLTSALTFYLGAKAGLLLIFVAGTLWRGFPLAPAQVILLELFMDLGASTSFVAQAAPAGLMRLPPRTAGAPFFGGQGLVRIGAAGGAMATAVLSAFAWGTHGAAAASEAYARSMSFAAWMLGHVVLAGVMLMYPALPRGLQVSKEAGAKPAKRRVLVAARARCAALNPIYCVWVAATALVLLLMGLVPGFQGALDLAPLAAGDWGIAVGLVAAAVAAWSAAVAVAVRCCFSRP